jgi:hypothetical protein
MKMRWIQHFLSSLPLMTPSQILIEDTTQRKKKQKRKQNQQNQNEESASKVLESDFDSTKLAKLSKQCVRLAICTIDMFPSDNLFAWESLEKEIARQQSERTGAGQELLDALCKLETDPPQLDRLIKYVNFC